MIRQLPQSIFATLVLFVAAWCCSAVVVPESVAAPRSEEETQTIAVYKRLSHAVPFILTKNLTIDPFFGVVNSGQEGNGSGVVINAREGIILTNFHVIADATKLEVIFDEARALPATVLGYDREHDLAVLKLQEIPKDLVAVEYGDSNEVEVGQRVLAIGNPFGLNRTLTSGIVSSLGRTVKSPDGSILKNLIQTDAAINPGSSGGPLLDMEGNLLGITTAIVSASGDSAGIGFAIPVNELKSIVPELIANGKLRKPKFGWVLDDTNAGPMVRYVVSGSPAAKAGIAGAYRQVEQGFLRGYVVDYSRADLLVSINGTTVRNKSEVEQLLSSAAKKGGAISFGVRRGGARGAYREVTITPVLE